jgi:heavy metal sensor kinase
VNSSSLRARVVTWFVGILAATLIAFGATLYFSVREYLKTSLEHSLSAEADAIGGTFLAHEEQKGQVWMEGEINEAYAPELSGRYIRIIRQDGGVLYQSGDSRDGSILLEKIQPIPFDSAGSGCRTVHQPGSSNLMMCLWRFTSSSGTRYRIDTGASVAQTDRTTSSVLKILLLITPLILVTAAIGGRLLMRMPLQPLVTLTERAEYVGTSKLGERLPVPDTHDEMERLALSLNRMISRLEDALSHNRRFSADVSHELRTPLTIMRGELEHVLRVPDLQQGIRDSVISALEEISRMARIVENLLAIARLDSGADAIDTEPADISELCRWTIEQMHLLAEEKQIVMQIETVPLTASVDAARMKQVFVNVIDNAIKYTPTGGRVDVVSFSAGRAAVIEVSDTGIGIPPGSLPHVFDRFYRADAVRSRASGGAGLGLSIVKAICNAHGGCISIRSTEGQGTTVRIELPLLSLSASLPESTPLLAVKA